MLRIRHGFLAVLLAAAVTGITTASEGDDLERATAPARPAAIWTSEGKPERLDFDFGDITGWLRDKGGWHVEGRVSHRGLACGTYEIGMRFGAGNPRCTDVVWLSEVDYGTRERHCNGAARHHDGGGYLPALAEDFARITCAERVIRCRGNCP